MSDEYHKKPLSFQAPAEKDKKIDTIADTIGRSASLTRLEKEIGIEEALTAEGYEDSHILAHVRYVLG